MEYLTTHNLTNNEGRYEAGNHSVLTFPFLNFVKVEYWENFPGIEDSWTHVVSSLNIAQPIMHDKLPVKLGKNQSLNSSLISHWSAHRTIHFIKHKFQFHKFKDCQVFLYP